MRFFLLPLVAVALLVLPEPGRAQAVMRNGDIFELRLSGMPLDYAGEFALTLTVGDNGEVSIPLIGKLRAGGLSTTQFADAMERKFKSEKIFTNPTVVINLLPQSRTVTVGGAVRNPSAVAWSNDLTLSTAITRASGFGDFANKKKIKVTREGQTLFFNLMRADKDPTQNPKLLPSDEVTVPE